MRHFKRIRSLLLQCVNIAHRARLVYGPNWPCGPSGSSGPARPSGLIGPIGLSKKKLLPLVPNSHPDAVIIERDLGLHKVPFKNFLAVNQLINLVKISNFYHVRPTKIKKAGYQKNDVH